MVGKYECSVCNRKYLNQGSLRVHERRASHTTEYKCVECPSTFTTAYLLRLHQNDHNGTRPYQCEMCEKKFRKANILKEHINLHYNGPTHKCETCGKVYSSKDSLRNHELGHIVSSLRKPTKEERNKNESQQNDNNDEQKTTKQLKLQRNHVTTHRNQHNKNAGQQKQQINIGSYKCTTCKQSYSGLQYFKRHVCRTVGRNHKCEICEKGFANVKCLTVHKRIHTTEQRFACDKCSETFRQLIQLKRHKINHGDHPYSCIKCGKAFAFRYMLKKHKSCKAIQNVNDEKICNQNTKQTKRNKRDARPKLFIKRTEIKDKSSTVRPFKCNECENVYTQKANLKIHLRMHTGERPFECKQCNRMFISCQRLRQHELGHSDKRKYKCHKCDKAYIWSSGLWQHKKICRY